MFLHAVRVNVNRVKTMHPLWHPCPLESKFRCVGCDKLIGAIHANLFVVVRVHACGDLDVYSVVVTPNLAHMSFVHLVDAWSLPRAQDSSFRIVVSAHQVDNIVVYPTIDLVFSRGGREVVEAVKTIVRLVFYHCRWSTTFALSCADDMNSLIDTLHDSAMVCEIIIHGNHVGEVMAAG